MTAIRFLMLKLFVAVVTKKLVTNASDSTKGKIDWDLFIADFSSKPTN